MRVIGEWTARDTTTDFPLAPNTDDQQVVLGWNPDAVYDETRHSTRDAADKIIISRESEISNTTPSVPIWSFDTDDNGVMSATDQRTIGPTAELTQLQATETLVDTGDFGAISTSHLTGVEPDVNYAHPSWLGYSVADIRTLTFQSLDQFNIAETGSFSSTIANTRLQITTGKTEGSSFKLHYDPWPTATPMSDWSEGNKSMSTVVRWNQSGAHPEGEYYVVMGQKHDSTRPHAGLKFVSDGTSDVYAVRYDGASETTTFLGDIGENRTTIGIRLLHIPSEKLIINTFKELETRTEMDPLSGAGEQSILELDFMLDETSVTSTQEIAIPTVNAVIGP